MRIMLDLESYGLGGFPTLVQIGAVAFDDKYRTQSTFNVQVCPFSCEALGSMTLQSTMDWWAQQGGYPFNGLPLQITEALTKFRKWLYKQQGKYGQPKDVVANGIQFDIAAMETYAQVLKLPSLWDYRAGTDMRTLYKFAMKNGFVSQLPHTEVAHDALQDCLQQIKQLQEIEEFLSKCAS